ncbi:hypothetical protein [Nostoc sp.]
MSSLKNLGLVIKFKKTKKAQNKAVLLMTGGLYLLVFTTGDRKVYVHHQ